jgi:hypothetical protein
MLIEHCYDPEPDLTIRSTWHEFIRSHWDVLTACDFFTVEQLECVIEQYSAYYHHERIHQRAGRIIEPKHPIDEKAEIICIERLGGLLNSYHRLAA